MLAIPSRRTFPVESCSVLFLFTPTMLSGYRLYQRRLARSTAACESRQRTQTNAPEPATLFTFLSSQFIKSFSWPASVCQNVRYLYTFKDVENIRYLLHVENSRYLFEKVAQARCRDAEREREHPQNKKKKQRCPLGRPFLPNCSYSMQLLRL